MERDYELITNATLHQFEFALGTVYYELSLARKHDKDVSCDDFFNEISELYQSVLDYQVLRYKNLSKEVHDHAYKK